MHTTIYKRDKDTILFLIENTCLRLFPFCNNHLNSLLQLMSEICLFYLSSQIYYLISINRACPPKSRSCFSFLLLTRQLVAGYPLQSLTHSNFNKSYLFQ